MSNVAKVIAIDGPSGSGKSTVAKNVADKLKVLYIDTGAMFRAIACYLNEKKVELKESDHLKKILASMDFKYGNSKDNLVEIDGVNLTKKIREHEVSYLASKVSSIASVREYLLDFQRALPRQQVCVMEGRDIGTIVFPNAFSKFYVSASLEVRAKRRLLQLQTAGEKSLTFEKVLEDVKDRDDRDINRKVAPLRQAEDAEYIDSSFVDINQLTLDICDKVKSKAQTYGISI